MHSMSLNKNHFCSVSVYHHLLSGWDVEKDLLQKVIYTHMVFFFLFSQINWLNVITPKSSPRQKAISLPERENAKRTARGLWLPGQLYSHEKKNSRNSPSFNKPSLNTYNVLGTVGNGASFPYCLFNGTGPMFRTAVTASSLGTRSMLSDTAPCSEEPHAWFNALLLSSWDSDRGPTNYTACHDYRGITLWVKQWSRLAGGDWRERPSFKLHLRHFLLEGGLPWCPSPPTPFLSVPLKSCFCPCLSSKVVLLLIFYNYSLTYLPYSLDSGLPEDKNHMCLLAIVSESPGLFDDIRTLGRGV